MLNRQANFDPLVFADNPARVAAPPLAALLLNIALLLPLLRLRAH